MVRCMGNQPDSPLTQALDSNASSSVHSTNGDSCCVSLSQASRGISAIRLWVRSVYKVRCGPEDHEEGVVAPRSCKGVGCECGSRETVPVRITLLLCPSEPICE